MQRYITEVVIHKLREADVLIGQGRTVADSSLQNGIPDKSCFWWRNTRGGLRINHAKRLRDLEAGNARLKKAVSELTIDKIILKEVAEGTTKPDALLAALHWICLDYGYELTSLDVVAPYRLAVELGQRLDQSDKITLRLQAMLARDSVRVRWVRQMLSLP